MGMKGIRMEDIRQIKKGHFMKNVKQESELKTNDKLLKVKLTHSKVEKVEYNTHKIQKYLQPKKTKITRGKYEYIRIY